MVKNDVRLMLGNFTFRVIAGKDDVKEDEKWDVYQQHARVIIIYPKHDHLLAATMKPRHNRSYALLKTDTVILQCDRGYGLSSTYLFFKPAENH